MKDPEPGKRAKGHLQRARPVDTAHVWVDRNPIFDLALDFREKHLPAAQALGLREQNQVLVTIHFPHYFVIADASEIQIGNAAEIGDIRFDATHIIAAPSDVTSCFYGEAQ